MINWCYYDEKYLKRLREEYKLEDLVKEGCLSTLGFTGRVISLKSEDEETRESGAGHVATEVYSKEYNKWVFVDG